MRFRDLDEPRVAPSGGAGEQPDAPARVVQRLGPGHGEPGSGTPVLFEQLCHRGRPPREGRDGEAGALA